MSSTEIIRGNYNAAYTELLSHFTLRDNILLAYIAATGTILSIALATSANSQILLSIPYLALGSSILVSQHNLLIGTLLDYMSEEVEPFLKNLNPPENAPQYTTSASYKRGAIMALNLRVWGHLSIIIIPCLISLYFNWHLATNPLSLLGSIWWFSVLVIAFAIVLMVNIHRSRIKHVHNRFKTN